MLWIETYQNIANIVVSTVTSATMYAYYFISPDYLDFASPILIAHLMSDLFITTKPDMILHHITSLTFISYNHIMNVSSGDSTTIILTLYNTEISTFFYVAKLFLSAGPNKGAFIRNVIAINDILFFMTFLKFRVYDFYVYIIGNPETYIRLEKYSGHLLLYMSLHTLYILNLYWFSIICKIVAKPLIKSLPYPHWICHKVLSYSFCLDTVKVVYLRGMNMIDMIGYVTFSLTSHVYYDKMMYVNNYLDDKATWPYIQYIATIHLTSFITIFTNVDFHPVIIWVSVLNHGICYIVNIFHLQYTKLTINRENKDKINEATNIQYVLTGFPMVVDTIILCLHMTDTVDCVNHFYTFICMVLILVVNPFYELSHIAFHIFLTLYQYNRVISM